MKRLLASFAVVAVCVTPAVAAEPSEADKQACTPDVFRLCSSSIPNVDNIVACLKKEKRNLSSGCRVVFDRRPVRQVKY